MVIAVSSLLLAAGVAAWTVDMNTPATAKAAVPARQRVLVRDVCGCSGMDRALRG
jgi:hypothetical protein